MYNAEKNHRFTVDVPRPIAKKILDLAKKETLSASDIIRKIFKEHFSK